MKTIDQKMKSMRAKRRQKIKTRATALIAEEMTLQELRQARKLTQVPLQGLGCLLLGRKRKEKQQATFPGQS